MGLSVLSAASIVTALLSYLRFAQVTAIFGANWKTDALAIAMVFPLLVRDVVAHSFGSAFIPIYSRVMEDRGFSGAVAFVNKTVSWLILISSVLMAVLWFSSGMLVKIISPSGTPELLELASTLLQILLPMVILGTVNGIMANFIKYEKRFTILAVAGVLGIAVSLGSLLVVKDGIGIRILPISMLVGSLGELIFLVVQSYRSDYVIKPSIARDPFMGQLARMAFPVVGGTMVGFFAPIADKMLASYLPESSVTAIDYANRIKNIVLAVVFQPFLILADLSFSAEAAKGKADKLLSKLRSNINISSFVMFPTAALLTVLALPVVSVFFQRGNFSAQDSKYVGYALAFYAPWLAQFGIGSLVSRAFYAQKDSATPVIIGTIGVVVNILLNVILVGPLGIGGLALATTLMSTSKTIYLTWSLSRKMGGLNLHLIVKEQAKILFANLSLIAVSLIVLHVWPFMFDSSVWFRFMQLMVYVLSGILTMILILRLSHSLTFTTTWSQISGKIKGKISR